MLFALYPSNTTLPFPYHEHPVSFNDFAWPSHLHYSEIFLPAHNISYEFYPLINFWGWPSIYETWDHCCRGSWGYFPYYQKYVLWGEIPVEKHRSMQKRLSSSTASEPPIECILVRSLIAITGGISSLTSLFVANRGTGVNPSLSRCKYYSTPNTGCHVYERSNIHLCALRAFIVCHCARALDTNVLSYRKLPTHLVLILFT